MLPVFSNFCDRISGGAPARGRGRGVAQTAGRGRRQVVTPSAPNMAAGSPSLDENLADNPALADLLTCTICMERYSAPKLLHCGHTFCVNCVERFRSSAGSWTRNVTCPICRKSTPIPPSGVSELQNDFRISQIRDAFSAVSVASAKATRHCDVCRLSGKRQEGTYSCLQCKKSMCGGCIERHRQQDQFRGHTLVKAGQDFAPVLCRQHEENCTHLCQVCHRLACVTCMLTSCSSHTCTELGSAVRDMDGHVQRLTGNLEERMAQLEECIGNHNQLQANKTSMFDDIEERINQHSSQLIRAIQNARQGLLEEVGAGRVNMMDDLSISRQEACEALKVLRALRQVTAGMADGALAPPLLAVLPSLNIMSRSTWRPSVPGTLTMLFHTEDSLTVGTLRACQDPTIVLPSLSPDQELPEDIFLSDWEDLGGQAEPSAPVFDNSHLKFMSDHLKTVPGLRDGRCATFLPDRKIAVTDWALKKVVIHMVQGSNKVMADSRLQNVELKKPHGIVYHRHQGKIFVACIDNNELAVLDTLDLRRRGGVPLSKVQSPAGLSVLPSGQLVVSEVGARRHGLSVHDSSGSVVRMWGSRAGAVNFFSRKADEAQLEYPYYLAVDEHSRILVADHHRSQVMVFDASGKQLLRFGDASSLGSLSGLAVDQQNNILLGHSVDGLERLSVFSPDGMHICTPLQWGSHEQQGGIRGLAAANDQYSVVTEKAVQLHTSWYVTY